VKNIVVPWQNCANNDRYPEDCGHSYGPKEAHTPIFLSSLRYFVSENSPAICERSKLTHLYCRIRSYVHVSRSRPRVARAYQHSDIHSNIRITMERSVETVIQLPSPALQSFHLPFLHFLQSIMPSDEVIDRISSGISPHCYVPNLGVAVALGLLAKGRCTIMSSAI